MPRSHESLNRGMLELGALFLPGMRDIEMRARDAGDLEGRPYGAEVPSRP